MAGRVSAILAVFLVIIIIIILTDENLCLRDKYSVYTGYFSQLNVQDHSEVIQGISDF